MAGCGRENDVPSEPEPRDYDTTADDFPIETGEDSGWLPTEEFEEMTAPSGAEFYYSLAERGFTLDDADVIQPGVDLEVAEQIGSNFMRSIDSDRGCLALEYSLDEWLRGNDPWVALDTFYSGIDQRLPNGYPEMELIYASEYECRDMAHHLQ
ncbi:hypothetical protein [Nesterenkonia sp. HG001]|uniref:hypothetical protein n=1 Tax=Nesterenkonia sp. HG001 TaxID=2983207 RepID=UPI002AC51DC1|nr:hypothetical protein [Nesterenkonia sp. HG001]MDZ5076749.1 hypothetical protein [Nesterenkonia sp. HG001]